MLQILRILRAICSDMTPKRARITAICGNEQKFASQKPRPKQGRVVGYTRFALGCLAGTDWA
jgi:hypothetical protein